MKGIIHIKLILLRCFLLGIVCMYLFIPYKSHIFNVLHSLSHKLELVFDEDHHAQPHTHTHIDNHSHSSEHHHQPHSSEHAHLKKVAHHQHDYLASLMDFFTSAEKSKKKDDKNFILSNLDEHIHPEIYVFQHQNVFVNIQKEWLLCHSSYYVMLSVTTPPPKLV